MPFVEFWSSLTYSVWESWHYILRQTEGIQLLARFVGWILSLWRSYRRCLSCFLRIFGQRASACTFDHLFVRLPSLCLEVCLSFVICLNISLPFIQLLLFEQDTSAFYWNSPALKFRNVLQHTESRSCFACNQNIKEDIFTELEVLLFTFYINWSSTKTSARRASNIRERTGYNV